MLFEMGTPKEEWLKEYSNKTTINRHSKYFDEFCEWANTNDEELVEDYKSSNSVEFAKRWGKRLVRYYNYMIKNGAKVNTGKTKITAPRSFFRSHCTEVKIKRGAIPRARMSMGEHEFRLEEFQKMYRVGSIEDKARLATAICLGWGAGDFRKLERDFIEPFLDENLEPPVAFWYERKKTGAPSRSHLTHEAIEALRDWLRVAPESQYVFVGKGGEALGVDSLNNWIKSLAKRAKIKKRGKIRFHLIRKFTLSQLSASGMNQWEAKLCVGKSIPIDIMTYLKDQAQNLREKFLIAESRLTLSRLTNGNHTKLGEVNERLETLENIIRDQEKELRKANVKIEVLTDGLKDQDEMVQGLLEIVAKLQDKLAKKQG